MSDLARDNCPHCHKPWIDRRPVTEAAPCLKCEAVEDMARIGLVPDNEAAPGGLLDMDDREAFKSYCDGNRAEWVEGRLAAVAYRMLMAQGEKR